MLSLSTDISGATCNSRLDSQQAGRTLRNKRSNRGPTLTDVARLAGCSPITASRAINTPGVVSEDLRKKVADAVAALGYQPNLAARALASIRTNAVGVIVPSLTMHIFTDVLRGIYDGVQPTHLRVMLGNSHYDNDEEERLVGEFLRQKPAAMIISGSEQTQAARRMLEAAGCPVIQIMDMTDDPIDCIVGFSHFEAGYKATRHLIDQGYRRIGFMAGWVNQRSHGRLDGWAKALQEAGIYDPSLAVAAIGANTELGIVPVGPSNMRLGEATNARDGRKFLRLLRERAPDLDAVFCNNDILALGALFESQTMGLRIPSEFGIAGFNDTELIAATNPPLTSLHTPRYEIGVRAVREALDRIEAKDAPRPSIVDLGVEVSIRESTLRGG